ncbi:MAG: DUF6378 domain-containing protein [Candidatus Heimdallarchaeota archaeon]
MSGKTTVEKTLKNRATTHGDFTDNAKISQYLKTIVKGGSQWNNMTPVQKEALEVILAKAARIVTGDPNHKDTWHDIGGYAKLAEDRIK